MFGYIVTILFAVAVIGFVWGIVQFLLGMASLLERPKKHDDAKS